MSDELTVEAGGETVGEAKGNALRELELIAPGLDRETVRFQVLTEGRRGLLGVGFEPARVVAKAAERPGAASRLPESAEAQRLRGLLEHVAEAVGVRCRIEIGESEGTLTGSFIGDDLGLLIGRHGLTIDAVQLLARTIVGRGGEERREVVVDAAGYRERRRRTLESLALHSAEEAVRDGRPVELEPMTAAERKLVHTYLEPHADVTTSSEGTEPNRFVVVAPTALPGE